MSKSIKKSEFKLDSECTNNRIKIDFDKSRVFVEIRITEGSKVHNYMLSPYDFKKIAKKKECTNIYILNTKYLKNKKPYIPKILDKYKTN